MVTVLAMRRRPSIAHALMIGAGIATFVTVNWALTEDISTATVLVIDHDAAAGTPVSELSLRPVALPADSELLHAAVAPSELDARWVLNGPRRSGDPLRHSDTMLAEDLGPQRYLTLEVPASLLQGLPLNPGDRVDIVAADPRDGSAWVVGSDIAIARVPSVGRDGFMAANASVLTLAVSPEQALDLVAADAQSELRVIGAGRPSAGVRP